MLFIDSKNVSLFNETLQTLESQLCSEIQPPPIMNYSRNDNQRYLGQNRNIQRFEYGERKSNNYRVVNQRPGLKDMY